MLLRKQRIKPEKVLEHPTTLKLFLFLKAKDPHEIGVREAQRALEVRSSSTVAWHLEKLEEAGYVESKPNNKYVLTKKGTEKQDLMVPVLIPIQTIKGLMIPRNIFLLSFLIVSAMTVIISLFFTYIIATYVGLAGLIVGSLLVFREYLFLRKQFRFYKFMSDEEV